MRRTPFLAAAAIALCSVALTAGGTRTLAQDQTTDVVTSEPKGASLLTIFLKHDQSKPLEQINAELRQQGFLQGVSAAGDRGGELARIVAQLSRARGQHAGSALPRVSVKYVY